VISSTLASEVIVVSFTKFARFKDASCVIEAGEHECSPKKSVVGYGHARLFPVAFLKWMCDRGEIEPKRPVPKDILYRILDGTARSPDLDVGLKKILKEQNLIHR
jgi:hypothetical protein